LSLDAGRHDRARPTPARAAIAQAQDRPLRPVPRLPLGSRFDGRAFGRRLGPFGGNGALAARGELRRMPAPTPAARARGIARRLGGRRALGRLRWRRGVVIRRLVVQDRSPALGPILPDRASPWRPRANAAQIGEIGRGRVFFEMPPPG